MLRQAQQLLLVIGDGLFRGQFGTDAMDLRGADVQWQKQVFLCHAVIGIGMIGRYRPFIAEEKPNPRPDGGLFGR